MSIELDQQAEKSRLARRRLLRGSFSAPAVLTLYSGGAVAASSSMRCATNQTNNPVPASSSNSISWIRVPVYEVAWEGFVNGSKALLKSRWVRGAELMLLAPTGPGSPAFSAYLAANEWQCIDTGAGNSVPAVVTVGGVVQQVQYLGIIGGDPGPTVLNASNQPVATAGTYGPTSITVPVRIESVAGGFKVAGIDGHYQSGTAMPQSCWTSFGGRIGAIP